MIAARLMAGLLGVLALIAAAPVPLPKLQSVVVAGAGSFAMASTNTGRSYRIQVFMPELPPPPGGYPVFYTTDGNMFFDQLADQMRVREYVDVRPAIIVGIGYPVDDLKTPVRLRMRDLIPDAPNALFRPVFDQWAAYPGATVADAGGAEAFYRFIVEELRPRLAAAYPVDRTNQTLYGHSLGGLFGLHVLFNHPEAFSTYVVSSPSILFNGRAIIAGEARLKAALDAGAVHPRVLFLVGSEENYPSAAALAAMPPDKVVRQAQLGRETDDVPEMAIRLKALKGPSGYEVDFHEFAGENHVSVTPASLSRALSFALSTMPAPLRK